MRDPIVREFARQTNFTPRPWVNPSTQARIDRVRAAAVDCITTDAPFAAHGKRENMTQPIDISRIPTWSTMHSLLKDGRATPTSPLGFGANRGRLMYTSDARGHAIFTPTVFQMDSIGYNTRHAEIIRQVHGGEGHDGGSPEDRSQRVYVCNTRPTNLEY